MTARNAIPIARVHDDLDQVPGARLLVDRVWPRGVSRGEMRLDDWLSDVAPSAEPCKWFGHDPAKWEGFRGRHLAELARNPDAVCRCRAWCRHGPVVLRDHLATPLERAAQT